MALTVSEAAYKKFKGNFTVGLQYAQALLNNGQYGPASKHWMPCTFCRARDQASAKVVYEQAIFCCSLDLIKSKKYGEALKKIDKSREWPERLGVGAPPEPDNRLQDYLAAYCLKKMNRTKEATLLQNAVVDYTMKTL